MIEALAIASAAVLTRTLALTLTLTPHEIPESSLYAYLLVKSFLNIIKVEPYPENLPDVANAIYKVPALSLTLT